MSLIDRIVAWTDRRAERRSIAGADHHPDLDALGGVAGHMLIDYRVAVAAGASRETLAQIVTGLAGCGLAMSRCLAAMGRQPLHAESLRMEGLLLLEIAYTAEAGRDYRGVRAVEFFTEPIASALHGLALAYAGWAPNPAGNLGMPGEPTPIRQRLDELILATQDVVGHRETVAELAHAHHVRGVQRCPGGAT